MGAAGRTRDAGGRRGVLLAGVDQAPHHGVQAVGVAPDELLERRAVARPRLAHELLVLRHGHGHARILIAGDEEQRRRHPKAPGLMRVGPGMRQMVHGDEPNRAARGFNQVSSVTPARAEAGRPPAQRLRQGGVLLVGALVLLLVLGDDGRRFFFVPIGLGLVYLAAALAGGRRGGYWATALVLLGWGAAVVLVREARPELDTAGLYLTGAGLGVVAGVLLARRGVAVDPLGLAGTVVAAGLALALAPQVEALTEARTFALAVGLVGLLNVVAGAAGRR